MTRHTDRASAFDSRKNGIGQRTRWGSFRRTATPLCIALVILLAPRGWGELGSSTTLAAGQAADQTPARTGTATGATVRSASLSQQKVVIPVGSSTIIDVKEPLTRASVAQPEVAEVTILTPLQVLVTGRGVGATQMILWDKENKQLVFNVMVEPELGQLRAAIAELSPGAPVEIRVVRDAIVLLGRVPDVDTAERVVSLAKVISPNVQNQLIVAGEQQVLLRCTVAEVNKRSLRELGINGWLAGDNIRDVFAVNQIGGINPVNIGAFGDQNVIRPGGLLFGTDQKGLNMQTTPTFSLGFPRVQMQLFFKAMRENDLLRVLAEPNLIALNGQQAKFVVGGEFPIPIPQGISGSVTIEFKEFGIQLKFQPTVIGRQIIRLKVEPEVSELDPTTAVTLQGFFVPGLRKRSAVTTVELASGSTIALAGLLSEEVRAVSQKLPALGDVPVLGALFSSVNYQKQVTELVILVTPELVSGMNPDQVTGVPGQYKTDPTDWQLFGLGMVEGEPSVDESVPQDALETDAPTHYRKFSSKPDQMSLHGPWGPEDSLESIVQ